MNSLYGGLTLLLLITAAVVLAAGCTGSSGNAPDNGTPLRTAEFPDSQLNPVFLISPAALSGSFRPSQPLSSFEDSFIGSMACSEEPENFSTNFTLITGSDGPKMVTYTLVPVSYYNELKELQPSPDILSARIEPEEFIAEPLTVYTSRFTVTIGPNVTGESGPAGTNVVYVKNPSFTYLVKVSVNGTEVPHLNDSVNIRKWCYLHSQTGDMQGIPSWVLASHEITLRAGERKEVSISLRNFGGGIRQVMFKAPAPLKSPGYDYPIDPGPEHLLPMPEGMSVTFAQPVMTERNFQLDSNALIISTTATTPPGIYHFPFTLCYRNLDPDNGRSSQYPFSDKWLCPGGGDFIVTIESGDVS